MATVTNKSEYFLSIVGTIVHKDGTKEPYRYRIPGPEEDGKPKSLTIEDHHIKHWDARTKYSQQGLVMIKMAPSRTVAHGTPSETPTEPDPDQEGIRGMHWRTAVKTVSESSDLDELEAMHEADDRPHVRKAVEERMASLR